jgi:endonuclease YncB( thermonuclease family)
MPSAAHPDGAWSFDVLHAKAIDGDTARILVDCGFGVAFRFDIRLEGINAPELRNPGGRESQAALQVLLDKETLTATTYRTVSGGDVRSFARWVGRLTNAAGSDIGDYLVSLGFAEVFNV